MKRLTSLLVAGAFTLSLAACHNADADKHAETVSANEATIDSMKMEIVKQHVVDSMQNVALAEQAAAAAIVADKAPVTASKTTARKSRSTSRSSGSNSGYSSPAASNVGYDPTPAPTPVYEPAPAPAPAKRGWSAKAKGAVIGAGAGAVGGAIINKRNRGAGAVIGGVGGAVLGTGVGAIIDRKKGR